MLVVLDLLHSHTKVLLQLEVPHMLELVFFQDLQKTVVGVQAHQVVNQEHGGITGQHLVLVLLLVYLFVFLN
jgi:hypothetical protein